MTVGELRVCLADVPDVLPVMVTYGGGVIQGTIRVRAAFEGVLWDDETLAGEELECFCIDVRKEEELEPYYVEGDEDEWHILRDGKFLMSFPFDSSAYYTEATAKAAAEAECARLNAEHRKEHPHGNK